MSCEHKDQPAKCVDLFRIDLFVMAQRPTDCGFKLFQRRFGQCEKAPRFFFNKKVSLFNVVLVFDFPNDLLNQVFDGHQAVDAAIFINNQRHMPTLRLHFGEQNTDRHAWGDKQQGTQNFGDVKVFGIVAIEPMTQSKILQVHKTHWCVQSVLIHRQSGKATVAKQLHQFCFCNNGGHRLNIGFGHRHILDPHPSQVHHTMRLRHRRGCGHRALRHGFRGITHTKQAAYPALRFTFLAFWLRAWRCVRRSVCTVAHGPFPRFLRYFARYLITYGSARPILPSMVVSKPSINVASLSRMWS
mmetsp:Transcript_28374/g.52945  ORF Transcript_28374/g.52945 Transcript_28374/m.52945 type:complete len:300 (+) Transcript_28374:2916-3815(+)